MMQSQRLQPAHFDEMDPLAPDRILREQQIQTLERKNSKRSLLPNIFTNRRDGIPRVIKFEHNGDDNDNVNDGGGGGDNDFVDGAQQEHNEKRMVAVRRSLSPFRFLRRQGSRGGTPQKERLMYHDDDGDDYDNGDLNQLADFPLQTARYSRSNSFDLAAAGGKIPSSSNRSFDITDSQTRSTLPDSSNERLFDTEDNGTDHHPYESQPSMTDIVADFTPDFGTEFASMRKREQQQQQQQSSHHRRSLRSNGTDRPPRRSLSPKPSNPSALSPRHHFNAAAAAATRRSSTMTPSTVGSTPSSRSTHGRRTVVDMDSHHHRHITPPRSPAPTGGLQRSRSIGGENSFEDLSPSPAIKSPILQRGRSSDFQSSSSSHKRSDMQRARSTADTVDKSPVRGRNQSGNSPFRQQQPHEILMEHSPTSFFKPIQQPLKEPAAPSPATAAEPPKQMYPSVNEPPKQIFTPVVSEPPKEIYAQFDEPPREIFAPPVDDSPPKPKHQQSNKKKSSRTRGRSPPRQPLRQARHSAARGEPDPAVSPRRESFRDEPEPLLESMEPLPTQEENRSRRSPKGRRSPKTRGRPRSRNNNHNHNNAIAVTREDPHERGHASPPNTEPQPQRGSNHRTYSNPEDNRRRLSASERRTKTLQDTERYFKGVGGYKEPKAIRIAARRSVSPMRTRHNDIQ